MPRDSSTSAILTIMLAMGAMSEDSPTWIMVLILSSST
jgi:hypothetical protein